MKNIIEVFNTLDNKKREEIVNDMSKYQRNIINELTNNEEKANEYSLNELLYDFDKDFIQTILEIEIDEYLKENKTENKRNGYTKDIELVIGNNKILFNRPRLRKESEFNSKIIPKRTKIIHDIKDQIILLYSKNNSVNDIKEIMNQMFGIEMSTAFISKITQEISEKVMEWRNRQLQKMYFTINIDCTYITIKDNKNLCSHKVPVYVAIGTRLDGHKEIVGMYLGNEDENKNVIDELYDEDIAESKTFWLTVFNDLKDRGLEKVLFIVSDGLSGMANAVADEFPQTKYQRCVVHLVRNLKKYTTKNNCTNIIASFKEIYTSPTKEIAEIKYNEFLEKYKANKTIIKKVKEYYNYIIPLFNETENIRKYIYTNNIVESANSKIKRGFYGRGALPNVESALNIIYVNLSDLENKWLKEKVNNWENIKNELYTVYYNEIKEYID